MVINNKLSIHVTADNVTSSVIEKETIKVRGGEIVTEEEPDRTGGDETGGAAGGHSTCPAGDPQYGEALPQTLLAPAGSPVQVGRYFNNRQPLTSGPFHDNTTDLDPLAEPFKPLNTEQQPDDWHDWQC